MGRYKGKGDSDVMLEHLGRQENAAGISGHLPRSGRSRFHPRLWATRRGVIYSMKYVYVVRIRNSKTKLTLARKYGIVTPYTAYLIIEDEQRRGVPVAQRTLRNFEDDREVLEQTRKQFEALKLDKAGDQAIGSARREGIEEATNAKAAAKTTTSSAAANFGFANGAPTVPTGGSLGGGAGQLFFADTKSNSARAVSQPMELPPTKPPKRPVLGRRQCASRRGRQGQAQPRQPSTATPIAICSLWSPK